MLRFCLRATEADFTHLGEHEQAGQQQGYHRNNLIQPAKVAQGPSEDRVGDVGQPGVVDDTQ